MIFKTAANPDVLLGEVCFDCQAECFMRLGRFGMSANSKLADEHLNPKS